MPRWRLSVSGSAAAALVSGSIRRPALEAVLDEAFGKRLTTLVAGPGYGKTQLLDAWRADVEHVGLSLTVADAHLDRFVRSIVKALHPWLPDLADVALQASHGSSPDATRSELVAGLISDGLARSLEYDLVVLLDDLHVLPAGSESARFVEALCRQAPTALHVVVAARRLPLRVQRLRGRGEVVELTGMDLAFTPAEVDVLTEQRLGSGQELAARVHAVTGGWPAAVSLVLEALAACSPGRERTVAIDRIARYGGPLYPYLAEEVFAAEDPRVHALLRCAVHFESVTADLCAALGQPGADAILEDVADRGLAQRQHEGWFALHGLVRRFAGQAWPLDEPAVRELRRRAARWFEERGMHEPALVQLVAAQDAAEVARLLREHGADLLLGAGPAPIVRLEPLLAGHELDETVEELLGEAHLLRGDTVQALPHFERAAGGRKRIPAALAWRLAAAYHLEDRLEDALAVERAAEIGSAAARDRALLFGWLASTVRRLGDEPRARQLATLALAAARESGDDQALALAHTALGLLQAPSGAEAGLHLDAALVAAQRAGDHFQLARIHNNRGSDLLERGDYDAAVAELDEAMRLAEVGGFRSLLALATMNRGLCRWCRGRFDEASADFDAAVDLYRAIGSREIAYAIVGRGDVHRERGELAQARAAYEQGLALGEQSGDRQALVPALYQLAKVLVDEEPERAEALARRAVEHGWPDLPWALNALGWVHLAHGDLVAAGEAAAGAARAACERDDPFGLAESLELRALLAESPEVGAELLGEALAIWRRLGNVVHEAEVQLALDWLHPAGARRHATERAERTLQEHGVRVSATGPAGLLRFLARPSAAPLRVETLGGFRVLADGDPIPTSAWRSKKARDLFQILIGRRGRPVPRDLLVEMLWPHEDEERLAHRLSVALSALRAVLDPRHRFDAGHFVRGERDAIAVDLEHVAVDVHDFLEDARDGLAARTSGIAEEGRELLLAADARYAGDFLEEVYEDWAVPLREEARAVYVDVVRALAEDAEAGGDHDASARFLLRVLERDPYDERAHVALVTALIRAGRHGDAQRSYRTYCSRMEQIGVEAAPYPRAAAPQPVAV